MTDGTLNTIMGFVAGFNLGLVVAATTIYLRVKKTFTEFYAQEKAYITRTAQQKQAPAPTQEGQDDSVTQRLNRASELTRIQNEIVGQVQQPSQNSAHSKHKNGLVQQYKTLEIEKMGILRSIIKDGHDPLVTVFNSTSKQNEEVKLSFFLTQFQSGPAPEAAPTDSNLPMEGEGIRKVDKNGKTFYVIDGGKKTTQ